MLSIRPAMLAFMLLPATAGFGAAVHEPVVVADFDYSDTSGEVRDQRADHERRVAAFSADLIAGLAEARLLGVHRLACGQADCSVDALGPERLVERAKASGARFLIYGGIHKISTLVEFLRIDMLDLRTHKVVASKLVTFRGDSDEAFKRAAGFVAHDLLGGATVAPM